jgi:hypothetical protein
MKSYHWIGALVLIALAYYAGTKGVLSKVTSAAAGAAGA